MKMGTVHEEVEQLINGIDVQKLEATIHSFNEDPDQAFFSFHATNEWVDGAKSKTIINNFNEAGSEIERSKPFVIHSDQPEVLMGGDTAPNPIMMLLHSLASCFSVTIVYSAALRGIEIDKLSISIDGDLDVHGFLGLSREVRPGFQDVRVRVNIQTNAPRDAVEDLMRHSQRVSPILDSLRNRIPVEITQS
jgi:uncharacterized OsmC-like protein